MVKHGNWNALQKTEAELQKDEADHRAGRVGSVISVARRMFDVMCEADLTADGRLASLEILNVLTRRLGDK